MDTTGFERSSNFKVVVILLLILVIALLSFIGYFTVFGGNLDLSGLFKGRASEYTMLLDEFVVNLRAEENGRNYVKTEMAVMYTDKGQKSLVEDNILKIRDTVINHLRLLTSDELLDAENTSNLKASLIESINTALGEDVIRDIYFSDLIIQ